MNGKNRSDRENHRPRPTIYLGADHGGYPTKELAKIWLQAWGYPWVDCGDVVLDPADDYPLYAITVACAVSLDQAQGLPSLGLLICRSAAGVAIVANKVQGVRAAVASDERTARLLRSHNDANVLTLSGDFLSPDQARLILTVWLEEEFSPEERHHRRVAQIERVESFSPTVIPGIFEQSLEGIQARLEQVGAHADWVQLDLADGHLVPSRSFLALEALGKLDLRHQLEVHLMVQDPVTYLHSASHAGVRRCIAHLEAQGLPDFLQQARSLGMERGLAVGHDTEVEAIRPWLEDIDTALVMTVPEGFSGQPFDPACLKKVVALHGFRPDLPIEVDGGINSLNAAALVAAGASRLVATSALFRAKDIGQAFWALRHPTRTTL
jgi:ribulose-phosphate 3-epimerase